MDVVLSDGYAVNGKHGGSGDANCCGRRVKHLVDSVTRDANCCDHFEFACFSGCLSAQLHSVDAWTNARGPLRPAHSLSS